MSKLKTVMAGLLSAALGFVAQGCFTAEPLPECAIVTASAFNGVGPYYAKLKQSAAPAANCTDANKGPYFTAYQPDPQTGATMVPRYSLNVGMQRFPGTTSDTFAMYVRTDLLPNIEQGAYYGCNDDLTNDCAKPSPTFACDLCVNGKGAAAKFADGGSAYDPAVDAGIVIPGTDAGVRVSLTNTCGATFDGVVFADSKDPAGKNVNNVTSSTRYPNKDSVCVLSPVDGGVQNIDTAQAAGDPAPMPFTCADGTTFAPFALNSEWSNIDVINSSKAPATYWTATLKLTEGACVNNYAVTAFWPMVDCTALDADGNPVILDDGGIAGSELPCDPVANLDAGYSTGSGISPFFKPKCDPFDRICTPSVTPADLK